MRSRSLLIALLAALLLARITAFGEMPAPDLHGVGPHRVAIQPCLLPESAASFVRPLAALRVVPILRRDLFATEEGEDGTLLSSLPVPEVGAVLTRARPKRHVPRMGTDSVPG